MKRSLSFANILSLTDEVANAPDVRKVRSHNFVHKMNVENFEFDTDEWERVDVEHTHQCRVSAFHDNEHQSLSVLFAAAALRESGSSEFVVAPSKLVVNAKSIRQMITAYSPPLDTGMEHDSKQECESLSR